MLSANFCAVWQTQIFVHISRRPGSGLAFLGLSWMIPAQLPPGPQDFAQTVNLAGIL